MTMMSYDSQGINKDIAKKIGEAIFITALTTTVSHLIGWAFEKLKNKTKDQSPTDKKDETK